MSGIHLKGVGKRFTVDLERKQTLFDYLFGFRRPKEEVWALKNVTFSVDEGECLGVIGRNGSGKSTLLKILAGIMQPTTGSVRVEGRVMPLLDLGVGFVDDLTGRENIYLYSSLLGIKKEETDQKIRMIIEQFGFPKYIDASLRSYSDGMRVRLAFSIAGTMNPDVLLIDEALIVGDNSFQKRCYSRISEYRKKGKTIILVTHDLATVSEMCDRTLLIENGSVKMLGETREVLSTYRKDLFYEDKKSLISLIEEKDSLLMALQAEGKGQKGAKKKILKRDTTGQEAELRYEKLQYAAELRFIISSRMEEISAELKLLEKHKETISSNADRRHGNQAALKEILAKINIKHDELTMLKEESKALFGSILEGC